MATTAQGTPTKEFFVEMLTRDIDLNDAILDLLDNCLDGVLRFKKKDESPNFYEGYQAKIVVATDSFTIQDNCGGIPRDVAETKAFRMGRPAGPAPENIPSVGIYGIGMKRAIFKMGKAAEVITVNNGKSYGVVIPLEWRTTPDSWDFPIMDDPEVSEFIEAGGTCVKIEQLNEGIADQWRDEDLINSFVSKLISSIQKSYSFIIEKGFKITVNDSPVTANPTRLLASHVSAVGINPFVYKAMIDGVSVKLAIGLYTPLPSEEEIDEYNDAKRLSSEAGWTIVCNDRVVLYNDKTFVTGWGEAGVPNYHTQFIGIKGLVVFESNEPNKLPMTTTKRGVDLSSPIYAAVKEEMRKGLKLFTNYTNQWKGRLQQEKAFSSRTTPLPIMELFENSSKLQEFGVKTQSRKGAEQFSPALPKPENEKDYMIIRYSRPKEEIEFLSLALFQEKIEEIGASSVGERCFENVLKEERARK